MNDTFAPRPMDEDQTRRANNFRDDFQSLHSEMFPHEGTTTRQSEAARLFAIARTHLETAQMYATKAISRENG